MIDITAVNDYLWWLHIADFYVTVADKDKALRFYHESISLINFDTNRAISIYKKLIDMGLCKSISEVISKNFELAFLLKNL